MKKLMLIVFIFTIVGFSLTACLTDRNPNTGEKNYKEKISELNSKIESTITLTAIETDTILYLDGNDIEYLTTNLKEYGGDVPLYSGHIESGEINKFHLFDKDYNYLEEGGNFYKERITDDKFKKNLNSFKRIVVFKENDIDNIEKTNNKFSLRFNQNFLISYLDEKLDLSKVENVDITATMEFKNQEITFDLALKYKIKGGKPFDYNFYTRAKGVNLTRPDLTKYI